MPKLAAGWPFILESVTRLRGAGRFSLPAYSEFMPPPRLGVKPTGQIDPTVDMENDPLGWPVSEWEEELELKPGLSFVARQIIDDVRRLYQGQRPPNLAGPQDQNLRDNPAWPKHLAERAPSLSHERFSLLTPLSLSRTQDDKGRVRWTLFGSSDLGPEYAFWKSFLNSDNPDKSAMSFSIWARAILNRAYGLSLRSDEDLLNSGFGVFPSGTDPESPDWTRHSLSGILDKRLVLSAPDHAPTTTLQYLLTFTPFQRLPEWVQSAYLAGRLHLLPCPASLIFWYAPPFRRLQTQLPGALQIPLLRLVPRQEAMKGLRVPQSGWLREPRGTQELPPLAEPLTKTTFARTNRWNRFQRYQSVLETSTLEEKVSQVLFSTDLQALGLYGKPMARNAQLWSLTGERILNGPAATPEELTQAASTIDAGGIFGYRFYYPPMRAGALEVIWHRPLVAWSSEPGQAECQLTDAPTGILAASSPSASRSPGTELFPRLLRRPEHLAAIREFARTLPSDYYLWQTFFNTYKLLHTRQLLNRPLPRSLAQQLLSNNKRESLNDWIRELPGKAFDTATGHELQNALHDAVTDDPAEQSLETLTLNHSATREFEESYWKTIAFLAHGSFKTMNNADPSTASSPAHDSVQGKVTRDLDRIGDWLIKEYQRLIRQHELEGSVLVGELPFRWETDFPYPALGGWSMNQRGDGKERNLLVVIPGRNRGEAVVMADHYDTAYMEDVFDRSRGGDGTRRAANGADDNFSATAALLQAAPIYFELSRRGLLERDIWLLHLTGEEFPADCLGARSFCRQLIEGTLALSIGSEKRPLASVHLHGAVILDMIAHNRDTDKYVFQISPGEGREAMELAEQAYLATTAWNRLAREVNRRPERQGKRSSRSADPTIIPAPAPLPIMDGEIRPEYDPRSSLFNTDGQIFSDVGIPVILLMENYDINRQGYHDTHDTMENIDLDYGAALAAIAIETVARLATRQTPAR